MLAQLVVDAFELGCLNGHGCGRLCDLLPPGPSLGERKGRPRAPELGIDRLEFGLGVLQFVSRTRAPLHEPDESGKSPSGVGKSGFETGDKRLGLVHFLGPRPGLEFGEHLLPAFEFGHGAVPLDFQQPAEQDGDRLSCGHMLAIHNQKLVDSAVNSTPDVTRAGRNHRADEGLSGPQLHGRRSASHHVDHLLGRSGARHPRHPR